MALLKSTSNMSNSHNILSVVSLPWIAMNSTVPPSMPVTCSVCPSTSSLTTRYVIYPPAVFAS